MTIDTLKQAVQALRYEAQTTNRRTSQLREQYEKLAAALEAMADQRPIGHIEIRNKDAKKGCWFWGFKEADNSLSAFCDGKHLVYAAPIATPEHDAKVRDAALEEAAQQCIDIYSWKGAFRAGLLSTPTLEACAKAIRALKHSGADRE